MKKLIPILLLAVGLSHQCFAQTITDGLTVTGGPAVVGADPGGAELLRVGGEIHCVQGPNTTTGLLITGAYPGIKLASTTAGSDIGITYAKSGKSYIVGAAIGEASDNFVFFDLTAYAARGRIRSTGEWEFLGAAPSAVGTNQVAIGGGVVRAAGDMFAGGNVCIGSGLSTFGGGLKIGTNSADLAGIFRARNNENTIETYLNIGGSLSAAYAPWKNSAVYETARMGGGIADVIYSAFSGTHIFSAGGQRIAQVTISNIAPITAIDGRVQIGGGRVIVGGTLSAKEIKVTTSGADYVFENDYKLRSLAEVEQFIAEHKHLPEMMSAKAMQADGMPVSEVVTKQLAKIEELTLYAIQAQKDRDIALARADAAQAVAKATQEQVAAQEARMSAQETRIQRLENLIRNLSPTVVP